MAKPTRLLKGQARVGMRVILMRGDKEEETRGTITNIGKDKYNESEGLSVLRDDGHSGAGVDDDWFCMLHSDGKMLYYDAGIGNDRDYLSPVKISWKDRIL